MNCEDCNNKVCLKTGKPCEEIEKLLPKLNTGRNSRREKTHSPEHIEDIAIKRAFRLKYGERKKRIEYED
jgi:hypothetical protein